MIVRDIGYGLVAAAIAVGLGLWLLEFPGGDSGRLIRLTMLALVVFTAVFLVSGTMRHRRQRRQARLRRSDGDTRSRS